MKSVTHFKHCSMYLLREGHRPGAEGGVGVVGAFLEIYETMFFMFLFIYNLWNRLVKRLVLVEFHHILTFYVPNRVPKGDPSNINVWCHCSLN